MSSLSAALANGSRMLSYALGALVVMLAFVFATAEMRPGEIASWMHRVLGAPFVVLLVALTLASLFCTWQVSSDPGQSFWFEAGMQAASGVATVALTYTLIGISMGIGSMADHPLGPDTVTELIRSMTEDFSLAFMTTAVGLPVSAILRTLLVLTEARSRS